MRALLLRLAVSVLSAAAVHAEPQVPGAGALARLGTARTGIPRVSADRGPAGRAADDYLCAWPGVLALSADATGASDRPALAHRGGIMGAAAGQYRMAATGQRRRPAGAGRQSWGSGLAILGGHPRGPRDGFHGTNVRKRCMCRRRSAWSRLPSTARPVVPVQREDDELTLGRGAPPRPRPTPSSARLSQAHGRYSGDADDRDPRRRFGTGA